MDYIILPIVLGLAIAMVLVRGDGWQVNRSVRLRSPFGIAVLAAALTSGCATPAPSDPDGVRRAVEQSLARTVAATLAKDIDAYMAELPPDLRIYDDTGREVTRDQQRQDVLRDWSIIVKTINLQHTVDRLELEGGRAVVWTSQRWERDMLRPDGSGQDTVVTTRRHKEIWKVFGGRWLGYDIEELEGEIFINGKRLEQ